MSWKFWVTISFRRFGDRYDEFYDDSFTYLNQKSEIFLMVKFEIVWRNFGRLNDVKTFGPRHTNLRRCYQNFVSLNHDFVSKSLSEQNFVNEKLKSHQNFEKTIKFHQFWANFGNVNFSNFVSKNFQNSRFQNFHKFDQNRDKLHQKIRFSSKKVPAHELQLRTLWNRQTCESKWVL